MFAFFQLRKGYNMYSLCKGRFLAEEEKKIPAVRALRLIDRSWSSKSIGKGKVTPRQLARQRTSGSVVPASRHAVVRSWLVRPATSPLQRDRLIKRTGRVIGSRPPTRPGQF